MSMQVIRDRLTAAGLQIPLPESWEGHVPLARLVRWIDVALPPFSETMTAPSGLTVFDESTERKTALQPLDTLDWILEAAGYDSAELPTGPGQIGLLAGLPVPADLSIPDAYARAPERSRLRRRTLSILYRHLRAGPDPVLNLRTVLLPVVRQHLLQRRETVSVSIAEAIWNLMGCWRPEDATALVAMILDPIPNVDAAPTLLVPLVDTGAAASETVRQKLRAAETEAGLPSPEVDALLGGKDARLIDGWLQVDDRTRVHITLLLLATAARHGLVSLTVTNDLLDALQARQNTHEDPAPGHQQSPSLSPPAEQTTQNVDCTNPLHIYVRACALLGATSDERLAYVRSMADTLDLSVRLRLLTAVALLDPECRNDEAWQEAARGLVDAGEFGTLVRTLLDGSAAPLSPDLMACALTEEGPVYELLSLPGIVIPPSMKPWLDLDGTLPDLDWMRLLRGVPRWRADIKDKTLEGLLASWMVAVRPHLAPVLASALLEGKVESPEPVAGALLASPTVVGATPLCLRSISRMTSDGLLVDTPEDAIELLALQRLDTSQQGALELLERSGPVVRSLARLARRKEREFALQTSKQPTPKLRPSPAAGQALERAWLGLDVTQGELVAQIRASPPPRTRMLESALLASPDAAEELIQRSDLWSDVPSDEVSQMILGWMESGSTGPNAETWVMLVDEILAPRGEVPHKIRLEIGIREVMGVLGTSALRLRTRHGWPPCLEDITALMADPDGGRTVDQLQMMMGTNQHTLLTYLGSIPQLWESIPEADAHQIVQESLCDDDCDRKLAADLVLIGFVLSGRPVPRNCVDVLCAQPLELLPAEGINGLVGRLRSDLSGDRRYFVRRLAELDDVSDLPGSPSWRAELVSALRATPETLTRAWARLSEWGSMVHLAPDEAAVQLRAESLLDPMSPFHRSPQVLDHAGAADVAMWRELAHDIAQEVVFNLLSSSEDRPKITGCMALLGVSMVGHPLTPAITDQLEALRSDSNSDVLEMAWIVSRLLRLCPLGAGPQTPSDSVSPERGHRRRRRQRNRSMTPPPGFSP